MTMYSAPKVGIIKLNERGGAMIFTRALFMTGSRFKRRFLASKKSTARPCAGAALLSLEIKADRPSFARAPAEKTKERRSLEKKNF